jgi:hypothetical protein
VPPTPHDNRPVALVHWLTLVAANTVPLVGWFAADWSAATTLIVYWFETAAGLMFTCAQGVLHQRWNPRRGHFQYEARQSRSTQGDNPKGPFLQGFLVTNLAFTAGHGIFIGALLLVLTHNGNAALVQINWRSVELGCLQLLVIAAIDFLADLPYLHGWSFEQLEQTADRTFGRVGVVHIALIVGIFIAAATDTPARVFGVFVVLKSLYSMSTALPHWAPRTSPRWLNRLMNRVLPEPAGKRFEDVWATDQASEVRRREQNEQPWTAARR